MAKMRRYSLRFELQSLWTLSWPMLVGQLATMGMGVADVVMTGHKSANDLAAVALGNSLWVMVIVTVIGIMMAINPQVAHEVGAGRLERVKPIVRQGLWMGLFIGLVAMGILNLSTLVLAKLYLEPTVQEMATRFVQYISFGLPALSMFRALQGYSTSVNQTKPIMVISLAGLGFNILMNWLLIYGHWGFPQLGAAGCAVATATGLWLMLAAMVMWIRISPAFNSTNPFTQWQWPDWQEMAPLLKMGLPTGIAYFAEVSAFASVGLFVARFGAEATGAHQIALNFTSVVFMVPMSLGVALITRVGQALGEGDAQRARYVGFLGILLSLGYGAISAAFIALFAASIAAAYTNDPIVQAQAVTLLFFAAVFQISDSAQVAAASALRGYKAARAPMLIQLLAFWVIAMPLGLALGLAPEILPSWLPFVPSQPLQAAGFWLALVFGLSIAALLLSWVFARRANRLAKAAH